jgi:putative transcriptional regulator
LEGVNKERKRLSAGVQQAVASFEEPMIQCRLRELMAAKGRQERRRITYDDILAATGISKNTLTRLANDRSDRVGLDTMERLCLYFNCQPGDLFVYVPNACGVNSRP